MIIFFMFFPNLQELIWICDWEYHYYKLNFKIFALHADLHFMLISGSNKRRSKILFTLFNYTLNNFFQLYIK